MHGGPGSVRLPFVHGTVRTVPVFGSDASCEKRISLCFLTVLTEEYGSVSLVRNSGVGGGDQTLILSHGKPVPSKSRGRRFPAQCRAGPTVKQSALDTPPPKLGGVNLYLVNLGVWLVQWGSGFSGQA